MIRLLGDWAPLDRNVINSNFNDFVFLNIEGPIIEGNKPPEINKAGPIFSHKSFIKNNPNGVGILSNNHLFDYGYKGYEETIKILKANKWFSVGAGKSKKKAKEPLIIKLKNINIGILASCEVQFGVSQTEKPGVAGIDPSIYKQIYDLKKKTDLIIVSYHGGGERLPWQSPALQDVLS